MTEQTSKRTKAFRLAGGVLLLAALAIAFVGSDRYGVADGSFAPAAILGSIGLALFAWGTFAAWVNHG